MYFRMKQLRTECRLASAVRLSVRARARLLATCVAVAPSYHVTAQSRIRPASPADVTQILEVDRACFQANLRSSQQSLEVPRHFPFPAPTHGANPYLALAFRCCRRPACSVAGALVFHPDPNIQPTAAGMYRTLC